MKFKYKDCTVEMTTAYDTPACLYLTPTIEIACARGLGRLATLTTHRAFRKPEDAERCGFYMARQWIDCNRGNAQN